MDFSTCDNLGFGWGICSVCGEYFEGVLVDLDTERCVDGATVWDIVDEVYCCCGVRLWEIRKELIDVSSEFHVIKKEIDNDISSD